VLVLLPLIRLIRLLQGVLKKSTDRKIIESFVESIIYMLCSIANGGRFYTFMFSSPRFRRLVKNRISWWRRRTRIGPMAT
ncbi:unnamed protein product, partial [Rotaria magnacalcarata]